MEPVADQPHLDPHGTTRKADAAHDEERDRHEDGEHRMQVLARIEAEVPLLGHGHVAETEGADGMGELVEAQRYHPAEQDEGEHPSPGVGELRLPSHCPRRPGRGEKDEEDRTRSAKHQHGA